MVQDPSTERYRLSPQEMADRLGLRIDQESEWLTVSRRFTTDNREEFVITVYQKASEL